MNVLMTRILGSSVFYLVLLLLSSCGVVERKI